MTQGQKRAGRQIEGAEHEKKLCVKDPTSFRDGGGCVI